MVALVTGHRGFLGTRIVTRLEQDGWAVVGAGRPDVELPSPGFRRLVSDVRPELVVHCAGPASVAASVADPTRDRAETLGALDAVLTAAPDARLVLISSAAVYGDPPRLPVREDSPLAPISPYGRHRVEAEELARAAGAPLSVARVFSAYGEGLRRQVLWDIARKALAGTRIDLAGTGSESRDFVHVEDVAAAVAALAAQAPFAGEAYNLATGVETPIARLADMMRDALGVDAEIAFTGAVREGDPTRWRADISRLAALGFSPAVPIRRGVARYAEWLRATS